MSNVETNVDNNYFASQCTPDIIGCIPVNVLMTPEEKGQYSVLACIDLVEPTSIEIDEETSQSPSLIENATFQKGRRTHQVLSQNNIVFSDFICKETENDVSTQTIQSQASTQTFCSPKTQINSYTPRPTQSNQGKRQTTKRCMFTDFKYLPEKKKRKNVKIGRTKNDSNPPKKYESYSVINPSKEEIKEFNMLLDLKKRLNNLEVKLKNGIVVNYIAALDTIVDVLKLVNLNQTLECRSSPGSTFNCRRNKLEKLFLLHCTLMVMVNQKQISKIMSPSKDIEIMDQESIESTPSTSDDIFQMPEITHSTSLGIHMENEPKQIITGRNKVNGIDCRNIKFRKVQRNEWIPIPTNELELIEKQFADERVFRNSTITQEVWDEIDDWS